MGTILQFFGAIWNWDFHMIFTVYTNHFLPLNNPRQFCSMWQPAFFVHQRDANVGATMTPHPSGPAAKKRCAETRRQPKVAAPALRRRVSVLGSLENALANPSCKEKHGGWGGGVSKLTCLKRYSFFFCPNHSVFVCHDMHLFGQICVKKIRQVRFKIWSALNDLPFPIPSMISMYGDLLGLVWTVLSPGDVKCHARSRRLIKRV